MKKKNEYITQRMNIISYQDRLGFLSNDALTKLNTNVNKIKTLQKEV